MNDRDQLREDRLSRVQTFGTENAADFPEGSKGNIYFGKITAHLAALTTAKIGQNPARASKTTLLEALYLDFKAIALTARTIGPADLGGSIAAYAVPANTEKDINTHAEKLLQIFEIRPIDSPTEIAAKTALRAKFTDWELSADFVADLRADYDALTEANKHNQAEIQAGVENTEAIDQILLAAGQDVEALRTIIQNKYARVPEKLHVWQTASRIHRAPSKKKPAPPTPTPPPA